MTLQDLQAKIIFYYKAKDELRLSVVKYLLAAVKNKEIELRPQGKRLDEEIIGKVLEKQIKQRKDSIESYKEGNRQDLVDKETRELEILYELQGSKS